METYTKLEASISELRKEIERNNKKLEKLRKKSAEAFKKKNSGNYQDISWLVNNPDAPGQYEALVSWIELNFGLYEGIIASGYYPSTNQQAFGFQFPYNPEGDPSKNINNIKKFSEIVLPLLKPTKDGFISFIYTTGYRSGVFKLDYYVDSKEWGTSTTTYGRRHSIKMHNSLDDALDFALAISQIEHD